MDDGKKRAFVSLGSNMGDRAANIAWATQAMAALPHTEVVRSSSLYETLPWGGVEQAPFLNSVVELRTKISPLELLKALLALEDQLGRRRLVHWGPRIIDLDLLIYNEVRMTTKTLTLPHPRLLERAFVLVPFAEIAPGVRVNELTIQEHLEALAGGRQKNDVVKWT